MTDFTSMMVDIENWYALRVTGTFATVGEILADVQGYPNWYVAEKSKKDKDHFHVVFQCTDMETFRQGMRLFFGKAGNKMWSIKQVKPTYDDLVRSVSYLYKSGAPVQMSQVDPEVDQAAQALSETYKKKGSLMDRITAACSVVSEDMLFGQASLEYSKIIIQLYKTENRVVNLNQIKNYVVTVMCKNDMWAQAFAHDVEWLTNPRLPAHGR